MAERALPAIVSKIDAAVVEYGWSGLPVNDGPYDSPEYYASSTEPSTKRKPVALPPAALAQSTLQIPEDAYGIQPQAVRYSE